MTYVSWAAMHEGAADRAYFDIVIPSLMEDLVRSRGTRNVTVPLAPAAMLGKNGRSVEAVAAELCNEREAFYIAFVHADTGGRALEAGMAARSTAYQQAAYELCEFSILRCVVIAPRHETEAWILADREAIGDALGYRGNLADLGLPANAREAEQLVDPKRVLSEAISKVRGRRSIISTEQIVPAIAQRQNFAKLRASSSFSKFESALAVALIDLGCIE